ncbi:MAG: amino acid permease C-terminal domain-containing protein, partial [Halobaculum sp.]
FFLLSFVVVNASVIRLRRQRPNLNRPFEMPLYPAAPVLGIGLNLLLGVFIDLQTWLLGAGWLALGTVTFYSLNRYESRETESTTTGEDSEEGEPGSPVTE